MGTQYRYRIPHSTRPLFPPTSSSVNLSSLPNRTPSNPSSEPTSSKRTAIMHLMYTVDTAGKRVYTLKKVVSGEVTKSAPPARFSPDDKYSRHRVTLKKRYGLLLTQQKDLKVLGQ